MSNEQNMLPCPHCGQSEHLIEQLDSDASVVICQGMTGKYEACLARGPVGVQQDEREDQPGRDEAIRLWNTRAAQPVAIDGMPGRISPDDSPHYSVSRAEEYGYLAGWNACHDACHDAFTAWLRKAAQGLPEPTAYLLDGAVGGSVLEFQQADLLECQNRYGGDIAPLVRLDAVSQLVAGLRAELKAERAELDRFKDGYTELWQERESLRAEVERLKGLQPGLPPFPPEGEGLPRYGLRWNGPQQPLATPMDDGYWTPWHLADALLASAGGGE